MSENTKKTVYYIPDRRMSPEERMTEMAEDTRYDVADNDNACVPDASAAFARESIKSAPPPSKVEKVMLSNDCTFNCAYCGCRSGNECKKRYVLTPRELAEISVKKAEQGGFSGCGGVFVTSSIHKNADYTEENIVETLRIIRQDLKYRGYLHAKIMPGADSELIRRAGMYANRLSVNLEVARSEGYDLIARDKNKSNILTPMRQIADLIAEAKQNRGRYAPPFAASQTTQIMAGSSGEDDFTILNLSDALYKKYSLKRVYYTAFHYNHRARGYEALEQTNTPNWRMARLYQADRLMQLYGFTPEQIAPPQDSFLQEDIDPKAAWALRNLHLFPIEVNTADYEQLLQIPGIGVIYAKRILAARRSGSLSFETLKQLGISLKKSRYFITAGGKFCGEPGFAETTLRSQLASSVSDEGLLTLSAV